MAEPYANMVFDEHYRVSDALEDALGLIEMKTMPLFDRIIATSEIDPVGVKKRPKWGECHIGAERMGARRNREHEQAAHHHVSRTDSGRSEYRLPACRKP